MTFSALPDEIIKGKVSEINSVGVTNQGVVNYDVKISFDNPANNILSGMTVSAVVTTEIKPDVLLVPNQAVKIVGQDSFVQILDNYTRVKNSRLMISPVAPRRVKVTVGTSNDTMTEISDGLSEQQAVVLQTINGSDGAAANVAGSVNRSSGASSLRFLGGGGPGGR